MTENGNEPEKVQSFKSENTTHWTWKRTRGEPAPKGSEVGGGVVRKQGNRLIHSNLLRQKR